MPRDHADERRVRAVPLRRRLLLLAVVAILPLALMSGVALRALWLQQRQQLERSTLDLTRALATAVDNEVLASRPEWRAILLAKPSGELVFNTGEPLGGTAPPVSEPDSFREAVRTRAPVVGSLARGPRGNAGIPVRVPVERNGELRYILTAVVRPEAILH